MADDELQKTFGVDSREKGLMHISFFGALSSKWFSQLIDVDQARKTSLNKLISQ